MDDPALAVLHVASLAVSVAVALLLYPVVRKGLALRSGLVFEMGRGLLLPPIFIAAFCAIYTSMEFGLVGETYNLLFHALADAALIAASLSLLYLALRLRSHLRKMEE
ncbi:MAG: hypothetical protein HZB92_09495 [Euryarchaeota archaeon]|nr:hypothetical protein [Euryarchaeota archaeon]